MIKKLLQYRREASKRSAAQPELITADSIKQVLQEFCNDEFSDHANQKWILDVLKAPNQQKGNVENLPQVLETLVDDFVQDFSADNAATRCSYPKRTLAMLAVYRYILVTLQSERKRGPMLLGPIFRLLTNAHGNRGKTYLPQHMCGEDAELAANRMPAYWTRLQGSAEQSVDDLRLPIATPPVMCWICGEGFVYNGARSTWRLR